ncbi:glycosyltransferase family 4 protein [Aerosakkonema funiforme]|uniref:glycosyltransferase family 4 protein n=1 Tax=Aerosakkonema funiforme TaxID=1246630 RepID=UPI0035BBD533
MALFEESVSLNRLLLNLSFLMTKPTGISTYAFNLFPHLKLLNPTLLVSRNIENFDCYPVPPNLTPEQGTKGNLSRILWTQLQLPKIYDKLKANLLFSPLPEAPVFSGCRYVVTVHDLIPLRFPRRFSPLTNYSRYLLPLVLSEAQHIICDSESTAKDVIKFFHIPERKVTPVLLAYDADRFRFLDLPSRNYFLYIGRHDPYKNILLLIEAFATLPNSDDRELWIAGSFDKRFTPTLKAAAEQLGICDRIKFLEYVPYAELPTIVNQAIALVFPSLWEGFGLPVLEAMACGTPVITSNLSSIPEVAGDAAILIDPYNVGEIAEAMQAVADDAELRSRLRQAGLARSQQFSWAKTGQTTATILQQYL